MERFYGYYESQKGEKPVTKEEGEKLAREIKANFYMECSAHDLQSVDQLFEKTIRRGIQHRESQTKSRSRIGFFR